MKDDRIIFHIDVNSAFLSWEAVRRLKEGETLDIRTVASVIGGDESSRHGVVLAKSISAQKFGISTGETLYSARQKCPDLLVCPSNFPFYSNISNEFFDFLSNYSPKVEQFSIDEGFLDFTGFEKLYGEPKQAAEKLKDKIFETFGFTVNIGVAPNKILAKMAGELKKPNLVHTMFKDELEEKLWPQPVRNLFMVGAKTEEVLLRYGFDTIGKLAHADPMLISQLLKSHGMQVWKYANGIDSSPVTPNAVSIGKSFSNSSTLSKDATTKDEAFLTIIKLCQSVCMRMRQEKYSCSTISIQIKYSDFSVFGKQMHIDEPTENTDVIFSNMKTLFASLWNGQPIRLIGVALSELSQSENEQITIFETMSKDKQKRLDLVCDQIRLEFGNHIISYGTELQSDDTGHLDRFFPNSGKNK